MPSESGHLDDALLSRISAICAAEPKVTVVYAFGSRISGQPRPDSDLDIGIFCESGEAAFDFVSRLWSAIQDVVSCELDVLDLRGTPIIFQQVVIRDGKLIFARTPDARLCYETHVLALADDERYNMDLQWQLLKRTIKEGTFGGRT
jgi:predicted nucleotidyltransferase